MVSELYRQEITMEMHTPTLFGQKLNQTANDQLMSIALGESPLREIPLLYYTLTYQITVTNSTIRGLITMHTTNLNTKNTHMCMVRQYTTVYEINRKQIEIL